jgi:transposase-like protein
MSVIERVQVTERTTATAAVYCPICTRTVEAEVIPGRKKAFVKPGQKCPRCSSALDAGVVLHVNP